MRCKRAGGLNAPSAALPAGFSFQFCFGGLALPKVSQLRPLALFEVLASYAGLEPKQECAFKHWANVYERKTRKINSVLLLSKGLQRPLRSVHQISSAATMFVSLRWCRSRSQAVEHTFRP